MTTTTRHTTADSGYAIVDADGTILSLHPDPVPAGEGWGFDRELIELRATHAVGDRVEYDEHGRETVESHGDPWCHVHDSSDPWSTRSIS